MSAKIFWTIVITGGFGGALVAQAQVGSPFANKKKRQAWETPQTPPAQNPQEQTPQAQIPLPQTSQSQQRPWSCLLYTSPSPRDGLLSRMPSSA